MPTPRTSNTATTTSPTVISRAPCTVQRPASRRTKARPARAPSPRTAGVESPRRATAARARQPPRPTQARPTPPSPMPSRTPPGMGRFRRPPTRPRPESTRSSQFQRVDVLRVGLGHELVNEDQLVLSVNVEDVRVGRNRAHALGDRPASGRFWVFSPSPERDRAKGSCYGSAQNEPLPQRGDENAGVAHALQRQ